MKLRQNVNELQAAHLLVSCLCAANLHAVRCRELLVRLQRGRTGEVEETDDAEKASVVTTCIKHFNERPWQHALCFTLAAPCADPSVHAARQRD